MSTEIKVKLTGSPIRRDSRQREYIKALGLRRMGSEKILKDTPAVRGLLRKAAHMLTIISEK